MTDSRKSKINYLVSGIGPHSKQRLIIRPVHLLKHLVFGTFLYLLPWALPFNLQGQHIERQVIASGGSVISAGGYQLEHSLGEVMASWLVGNPLNLQQGFQQILCVPDGDVSIDLLPGEPPILTCARKAIQLIGTYDLPNAKIRWLLPDNSILSDLTTITISEPGEYQFIASANGCASKMTLEISMDTLSPPLSVPGEITLSCYSPDTLIRALTDPGIPASFAWAGGEDTDSLFITGPGDYQITVTNEGNGCTTSFSVSVIEDKSSPSLSSLDPQGATTGQPGTVLNCVDDIILLTNTPSIPPGRTDYRWSGPQSFGSQDPGPSVTLPGLYRVTITDTANGCTGEASVILTESKDVPVFLSMPGAALTCRDASATLLAVTDPPTGLVYSWTRNGTGIAGNQPGLTVIQAGVYTLSLFNPLNQCRDSNSVEVADNRIPPGLSAPPGPFRLTCDEPLSLLSVTADASAGAVSWAWLDPQGDAAGNGPDVEANTPGSWSVQATRVDNGCQAERNFTVSTDITEPRITFFPPELACNVRPVLLRAQVSGTSSTQPVLEWFRGEMVLESQTFTLEINDSGLYRLRATDNNGCTGEASLSIGLPTDTLATYFSPNGDGFNDRLEVILCSMPPQTVYKVTVFNRWGNVVMHADRYQNDWEGHFKGQPLPDGTYYYIVEVEGMIFKSYLTLRR